jgi:DNA-binding NtrC family response regulator
MKKILIIEDDKRIAASLEIRLKGAGYQVATASDGLKGLTSAIRTKPDLIVSDIWLPSAIGFLVAERLKNVGLGETPIIFITASKKHELWELAQEVGAVAFFEKPYDSEKLLKAISSALDKSSVVRAEPAGATANRKRKP